MQPTLQQLAKYCHLSPNSTRQLAHFHNDAHSYALQLIQSGTIQPPFSLCQQWHKQNNVPIDWDLYYRIKAKYSDNAPTSTPHKQIDNTKQRVEEIKINNINQGTQKLKDNTEYATIWIQFAHKLIPADITQEIISQSSQLVIDPIYNQLLKN